MNEDEKKFLNIFDKNINLKTPESREKQEKIKELIIQNVKLEGIKNESQNRTSNRR